ncbi:hypothetical protein HK102_012431, partial [Quaeritorhiza haematococci]
HVSSSEKGGSSTNSGGGAVGGAGGTGVGSGTGALTLPSDDRYFAFAFLPLLRGNHTVINDGLHNLTLYKYDRKLSVPAVYLTYPAGPTLFVPAHLTSTSLDNLTQAADAMSKLPALKDSFSVRTNLCSTKLTQNVALLNLLHWQSIVKRSRGSLDTILGEFMMIGEMEIIKFLTDIFDALFGIYEEWPLGGEGGSAITVGAAADNNNSSPASQKLQQQQQELDQRIFHALVFILGIVLDKRFTNHRPTVDEYIDKRFKSPLAWVHLIQPFQRIIADPTNPAASKDLRAAIK